MQPQALQSLPQELRTPPLPLVALVGSPEVHREFGVWASQVLRPPLVAVAVADANEGVLTRLFGECACLPLAQLGAELCGNAPYILCVS
jgi:hypothetical protein